LCVARFDEDTKTSFLDLYSKIENPEPEVIVEQPIITEEIPF
jgi:hypothetical protein